MLKKLAIAVAVLLVVFVGVVASRPATLHVERNTTMLAPPEVVFGYINDFHRWGAWSPWEKLDPNLKREFSGAQAGEGAEYGWSGNEQVGKGNMTIATSDPAKRVVIDLRFLEPWEASNVTTFRLDPAPHGTKLTWAMDGEQTFTAKAASLFLDMDATVGSSFEEGLGNLKRLAEAEAQRAAAEAKAKAAAAEQAELEALIEEEAKAAPEDDADPGTASADAPD